MGVCLLAWLVGWLSQTGTGLCQCQRSGVGAAVLRCRCCDLVSMWPCTQICRRRARAPARVVSVAGEPWFWIGAWSCCALGWGGLVAGPAMAGRGIGVELQNWASRAARLASIPRLCLDVESIAGRARHLRLPHTPAPGWLSF